MEGLRGWVLVQMKHKQTNTNTNKHTHSCCLGTLLNLSRMDAYIGTGGGKFA